MVALALCVALTGCGGGNNTLHKAVEQGDVEAIYDLATAYLNGDKGIPQDRDEGLKWLRKAAEQGHATAMWRVGILCLAEDTSLAGKFYALAFIT